MNNVGEWIRWFLAVAVIPAFIMVVDLRQTVAIQQTQIVSLKDSLASHALADGSRIDKIAEKSDSQNDSLIQANAALAALKEKVNDVLESLRSKRRGG